MDASSSSAGGGQPLRQPLLDAAASTESFSPAAIRHDNRTPLLGAGGAAGGGSFGAAADSALGSSEASAAAASSSSSSSTAATAVVPSLPPPSSSSSSSRSHSKKEPWMRRAEKCVRGFERRKQKQLRRKEWGWCSLAFPNPSQEREYLWYMATMRERNMRGSMLLLSFAYCLYATIEWRDNTDYSLTASRVCYVVCILGLFCFSYARPSTFRVWLQEWTLAMCAVTSLNILLEALILRAVYSPFVVIIMLLFLLASSVLVRLRFSYTSGLCWCTLLIYDLICLVRFRHGDDYLNNPDSTSTSAAEVAKWIVWYNLVLVFTICVVQKIAHRVEIQSRYEYLTSVSITARRSRAKRARRVARAQRQMQTQYALGAAATGEDALAAADGDAEHKDEHKHDTVSSSVNRNIVGVAAGAATVSPAALLSSDGRFPSAADDDWGLDSSDDSSDDDDGGMTDGGEGEDDDEDPLMNLDDGGMLATSSSTLKRLNGTLQKALHDLLFTPATNRQAARLIAVAEEEEEKKECAGGHPHPHVHRHGASTSSASLSPSRAASPTQGGLRGRSRRRGSGGDSTVAPDGVSHALLNSGLDGDDGSSGLHNEDDPPVPVDQMSLITRALAQSGVSDMGAFLNLLARKPEPPRRTTYGTTTCDQLPEWFLAYPNIIKGYRVNFTAQMCLQSAFKWHNETLNVWTEFIPALAFFIFFFYVLSSDSVLLAASLTDRIFVALGLFGAQVIRPLISGLAHLMYPQNERSYVMWWGADYFSICLSIFCSCAVFGRFAFFCTPDQATFFYVSLTGLFLSTIIAVLFVSSNGVRTGSFLLFVLFATGVPFWYTLADKWGGGGAHDVPQQYLILWVVSLGCFLVGLVFKSSGFPESLACACVRPGSFDIVGGSHATWHICINVGNALIWPIWRHYLQFRQHNAC